jgi:lauroyl/myristoyl acyltransferase
MASLRRPFSDLSLLLQLPLNVCLSRHLPLKYLRVYVYALGILYFTLKSRERSCIANSLRDTLHTCGVKCSFPRLAASTFAGILEHYAEKLHNAYRPLSANVDFLKRCVAITNGDWLHDACERGHGCLVITGHFGAVEYLPLALSVNGFRIAMIVRYKTRRLKEACEAIAGARHAVLIDAGEPAVVRRALAALKNGRVLITQCDEFKHWVPSRSKSTRAFGVRVPQDRTVNILYERSRAPACLALMKRVSGGYQLLIDPLAAGREKVDLSELSWRTLERYILKYPDQWYQWKAVATAIPALACQGARDAAA